MWPPRPIIRRGLHLVMLFALVGCTSGTRSTDSADTSTSPASVGEPSQYPVGREWRESLSFLPFADDSRRSYVLTQKLIQQCMASRGFQYLPIEYVDTDTSLGRAFNPLNVAVAMRYGYHLPPLAGVVDRNVYDIPAFSTALLGSETTAEGSCVEQSSVKVQGPTTDYFDAVGALLNDLDHEVAGFESTAEGVELTAKWSDCMEADGYHYANQLAASTDFAGRAETSPEELAVRTADLGCDKAVDLTASRSRFERSKYEVWRTGNEAVIAELGSIRAKAMKTFEDLEASA